MIFARDMFFFSFYTRGMAFVDLFNLKKSNIVDGKLCYCRSKTGRELSISIESCMTEIIDRYSAEGEQRLFPFSDSKSKNGKHTSALWI